MAVGVRTSVEVAACMLAAAAGSEVRKQALAQAGLAQ
jgi:hypothetical protein